jgi:aminoglycoside phosphotransferase (APT) family kinase protein
MDLGFPHVFKDTRETAKQKFKERERAAVSHGDVHLRNILIRGDRSAHLIDFAGSGPGHPAVDLARLEVSLFTEFLRPVRPENDYTNLQRRLSIDGASFDDLVKEFELDNGPRINKLCVHGCVAARDSALQVLREHGGGRSDYLAAKYLIAWQTMLLHGRQAILTRSIVRAITESFAG